jgi:hypothetical protein
VQNRVVPRPDILRRFTIKKDVLEKINVLLAIEAISSKPIKPNRSLVAKERKQIIFKK